MKPFNQLGLSTPVLKAIAELGFETPSDIQAKAIPHLLPSFEDFIGLAQTGTGKTAAFGLPLVEQVDPDLRYTQALILTPTRELGQQVAAQLAQFSKYLDDINVMAVYGGAPINRQINQLRSPQQIIIATPGRLIDLMNRGAAKLDRIRFLILDEADEMLNMGFKDDLDYILGHTPKNKVTWLFSATMEKEVRRIAEDYMSDPTEVRVNPKQQLNENIAHQYCTVSRGQKKEALLRILKMDPDMRGIVFCRTKHGTKGLAAWLSKRGVAAGALHGNLSQPQRDRVMQEFRQKSLQYLVATDIAARGIDVSELSHVIHYDLPDERAYYTHRSGRTARAGRKGISLAIVDEANLEKFYAVQKSLKVDFERIRIPDALDLLKGRLEKKIDSLIRQPVSDVHGDLYLAAIEQLENFSKEDLILRLVSMEVSGVSIASEDLNSDPSTWTDIPKSKKKSGRGGGGGGRNRGPRAQQRRSGSRRKGGGSSGGKRGGGGRRR